jgi:hypothetical protein
VHLTPYSFPTLLAGITSDRYDDVHALMAVRDLGPLIPSIDVPVYLQCAWHDQIFGTSAVLDAYDSLRSPKKLMLWSSGHAVVSGTLGTLRLQQTLRFYDRWLRENRSDTIMTADSQVLLSDFLNSDLTALSDSLLHHNTADTVEDTFFYIAGDSTLTSAPPITTTIVVSAYQQNITNDLTHTYTSPAFDSDYTMFHAVGHFNVTSSAVKYEVNALLYDIDDTGYAQPVARGAYQVRPNSTQSHSISYRLDPVLHTFLRGHRLRLRLKFGLPVAGAADEFGMAAYPPQASGVDSVVSSPEGPSYIGLIRYKVAVDEHAGVTENPVAGQAAEASITLFPGDSIPLHSGTMRVDLFSATGKQLTSTTNASRKNLSNLAPGIYLLREIARGGAVHVRKLLLLP